MLMPGESGAGGGGATPDPKTPGGGDFAALAPDLTQRIGTILEAVQREADKMLAEARGEAQGRIDLGKRQADGLLADRQRRIAELSDTLIAHTENVVAQLEETELVRASFGRLLRALSEAADRVTERVNAAPMPPPAPPAPPAAQRPQPPAFATPPVQQAPPDTPAPGAPFTGAPAPSEPALSESAQQPEHQQGDRGRIEARQAAIQMAAAGTTRAQVEAHLRGFLRVADPTPLLDQVFGAATAGETRVPWAIAPSAPASQPDAPRG